MGGDALAPLRRPAVPAVQATNVAWFPDPEHGFVLAKITSQAGGRCEGLVLDTGASVQADVSQLQKATAAKEAMIEDMSGLTELNTATVLGNIRQRYAHSLIYTYSGLFCVVVNPYTYDLDIYNKTIIEAYHGKLRHLMPPHVYAIADEAYRTMREARGPHSNQSILCTGESGAGKTENTKKVMQYLAHVASSGHTSSRKAAGRFGSIPHKSKNELMSDALSGFSGKFSALKKSVRRWRRKRSRKSSIAAVASTEGLIELGDLEQQVLSANDILEPFGNAKTTRNGNSSRFGKFIRVIFDESGYLSGAQIDTYLLEKARVLQQLPDERNFHVFYQLLSGADPQLRARLQLKSPNDYVYLTNADSHILKGVDDAKDFATTVTAMKQYFGMSDAQVDGIWDCLAAVLEMGCLGTELKEDNQEQAHFTGAGEKRAHRVCELLGIADMAKFRLGLLEPLRGKGVAEFRTRQTTAQVAFVLGAVAKALYERVFAFLVLQINTVLGKRLESNSQFVGILDIAGFEIFESNSLEQLCINFTNEKLQQLFNTRMFKLEMEEYHNEGITWEACDFGLELQPTINLIEGTPGSKVTPSLLGLLDDASAIGGTPDDEKFVRAVLSQLKSDRIYEVKLRGSGARGAPKNNAHGSHVPQFVIKHYAGDVHYNGAGWIDKNMDPTNDNVTALLAQSSNSFIAMLWEEGGKLSEMLPSVKKRRTVTSLYKSQLGKLTQTLSATKTHFVRCIKPNDVCRPGLLQGPMVLSQLTCNGVLEGIRIARAGFPNRVEYAQFNQQYRMLAPDACTKGFVDSKQMCKDLLQRLKQNAQAYPFLQPEDAFQFGTTKVFFRVNVLGLLDEARNHVLERVVVQLQARARGYLARRYLVNDPSNREAVETCQRAIRHELNLRSNPWIQLFRLMQPTIRQSGKPVGIDYAKVASIQADIESHAAQAEQVETEAELARARLEAAQETIENLKAYTNRIHADKEEMQHQIDLLAHSESNMSQRSLEREQELRQVAQHIDKLTAEKSRCEQDIMDLHEQAQFSAEAETLERQVRDIKAQVNFEGEGMPTTEQALQVASKQHSQLTQELRAAVAERETAEAAAQTALAQKEQLAKDLEEYRSDAARAVASLTPLTQELNKLKEAVTVAESAALDDGASVRAQQTQLLHLRTEIEDKEEDLRMAKRAVLRLEDEKAHVREEPADVGELEQKARVLKQLIDDQETQKDTIDDAIIIADKRMSELHLSVSVLEQKLGEMAIDGNMKDSPEVKALRRQLDAASDECDQLRAARLREEFAAEKMSMDMADLRERLRDERDFRQRLHTEALSLDSSSSGGGGGGGGTDAARAMSAHEASAVAEQLEALTATLQERRSLFASVQAEKQAALDAVEVAKQRAKAKEREYYELKEQLRAKERIIRETGDEKLAEMVAAAIAKERARGGGGKITWRIVEKTTVSRKKVRAGDGAGASSSLPMVRAAATAALSDGAQA
eukprot:m.483909 g.483909  ORF g.483909 m.483909 type:complete len:1476 (-) comp23118_c0_seq1:127-4554(-)